jgi:hypothetical protein
MQKTSFCEREISKISNLILVVIDTRCSSFVSIILVIYWSYIDKHSSFICRVIFKVKRLKMNKFIRSSSRSFLRTRTLTSFRFMNSNFFSRVFHLFNSLAARLIASSSLDVFFHFSSSSSFERFVSSSSWSSLSYSLSGSYLLQLFYQGTGLNPIREEQASTSHKSPFCTIDFLL